MKFERTKVMNFENAIRGMRNAWESWDKSDSRWETKVVHCYGMFGYPEKRTEFVIGENDLELMQKLIKAGSEHRKFMRQILVSVDITAPLYWWKEADTYKVGTVSNSTSTMHKLASTPITMNCFEMGDFADSDEESNDYNLYTKGMWSMLIDHLEALRKEFNETKDKRYWKELIRLLPESWLQKRTITMNYENILNMYRQRKHHKLTEWSKSFCDWVKNLPYAEELIFIDELRDKTDGEL